MDYCVLCFLDNEGKFKGFFSVYEPRGKEMGEPSVAILKMDPEFDELMEKTKALGKIGFIKLKATSFSEAINEVMRIEPRLSKSVHFISNNEVEHLLGVPRLNF